MKIDTDHCWHHGYEPVPSQYHRICVECGHVYTTAAELLTRTNDLMRQIAALEGWIHTPEVDVHAIHTCPLCSHDF